MSDIGFRASITASTTKISETGKVSSEKIRLRDLTNAVPVGIGSPRAEENNQSHSPLGAWMKEESPFSHRQLMTQVGGTKKALKGPMLHELLNSQRSKFTADGYAGIMDVLLTIGNVRNEIDGNMPLSKLTVRGKSEFQESLGLYEEHFRRLLGGFSNARFSKDVDFVVNRVRDEVSEMIRMIGEVSQMIKAEIRPSLEDINRFRV